MFREAFQLDSHFSLNSCIEAFIPLQLSSIAIDCNSINLYTMVARMKLYYTCKKKSRQGNTSKPVKTRALNLPWMYNNHT